MIKINYNIYTVRSLNPPFRYQWKAESYDMHRDQHFDMQSDVNFEDATACVQNLLMNIPRIQERFEEVNVVMREEWEQRMAQARSSNVYLNTGDAPEPYDADDTTRPQIAYAAPVSDSTLRTYVDEDQAEQRPQTAQDFLAAQDRGVPSAPRAG